MSPRRRENDKEWHRVLKDDGEVGDWRTSLVNRRQIAQGLEAQSVDCGQRTAEMFCRSGGGEPGMWWNSSDFLIYNFHWF